MEDFTALYRQFYRDVYRYLLSLTRDADLAEELASETFCAALVSLPRFRGECSVRTWLFSIARHQWLRTLRRRASVLDTDALACFSLAGEAPGPGQAAELHAAAGRAVALLEAEPPRTQRVVKLRLTGATFYEIGQQLGISAGSARVIDFRARARLREALTREGYGD